MGTLTLGTRVKCMYVCMCMLMHASAGMHLPQCRYGGQWITSGLDPHFSPCLRQLLAFAAAYARLAHPGQASREPPISAFHLIVGTLG